jgi:hypothetical protein
VDALHGLHGGAAGGRGAGPGHAAAQLLRGLRRCAPPTSLLSHARALCILPIYRVACTALGAEGEAAP